MWFCQIILKSPAFNKNWITLQWCEKKQNFENTSWKQSTKVIDFVFSRNFAKKNRAVRFTLWKQNFTIAMPPFFCKFRESNFLLNSFTLTWFDGKNFHGLQILFFSREIITLKNIVFTNFFQKSLLINFRNYKTAVFLDEDRVWKSQKTIFKLGASPSIIKHTFEYSQLHISEVATRATYSSSKMYIFTENYSGISDLLQKSSQKGPWG